VCAIAERSADRKQLVFTAFDPVKGRGAVLAKANADATTDYHWDLSPDGTRIAILKHREGRIQILSLHGETPQEITSKGWNILTSVGWAADGNSLFVSSLASRGSALLRVDLKGKVEIVWEETGSPCTYGVASPDGRHLAIQEWTVESNNLWQMENF
jgi:Tol biopolymer transport system component